MLPLPAQDSDLSEGWSLALSDTESLGMIRSPKAPRAVRRRSNHDRPNDKLYYESGRINGNRQPEFDFEIVSVNRVNECIELSGFSLNVTSRFAMQWRGLWIAHFLSPDSFENLKARAGRGL